MAPAAMKTVAPMAQPPRCSSDCCRGAVSAVRNSSAVGGPPRQYQRASRCSMCSAQPTLVTIMIPNRSQNSGGPFSKTQSPAGRLNGIQWRKK